jgi:hypothetical protein
VANTTTIVWDDVTDIAPELSTTGVGTQNAILLYVNATLSEDTLGNHFKMAAVFLAAHFATVSTWGTNGSAGPVTAHSVGDVSEQFAWFSPAGSDAAFDQTPYGRLYRGILKRAILPIMVI